MTNFDASGTPHLADACYSSPGGRVAVIIRDKNLPVQKNTYSAADDT